ncbi:hypothetical protein B0H10DRAFT_1964780 [Mycena sp. CBHHK59/15]|nr:hypothetical protein B0H10DRAFT_1964780 [Mycena sp. CBHHK59/15]
MLPELVGCGCWAEVAALVRGMGAWDAGHESRMASARGMGHSVQVSPSEFEAVPDADGTGDMAAWSRVHAEGVWALAARVGSADEHTGKREGGAQVLKVDMYYVHPLLRAQGLIRPSACGSLAGGSSLCSSVSARKAGALERPGSRLHMGLTRGKGVGLQQRRESCQQVAEVQRKSENSRSGRSSSSAGEDSDVFT